MESLKTMSDKKRIPDSYKIFLFRWWAIGACCFLCAFGTGMGISDSPLDLIVVLASVISAVMIFIFNPSILMAFNVYRCGHIVNQEYRNQRVSQKTARHIREIFKCYFATFFVYMLYQGANMILVMVQHYDEDSFIIPVEPILFGLLFSFVYSICSDVSDRIVVIVRSTKKERCLHV